MENFQHVLTYQGIKNGKKNLKKKTNLRLLKDIVVVVQLLVLSKEEILL